MVVGGDAVFAIPGEHRGGQQQQAERVDQPPADQAVEQQCIGKHAGQLQPDGGEGRVDRRGDQGRGDHEAEHRFEAELVRLPCVQPPHRADRDCRAQRRTREGRGCEHRASVLDRRPRRGAESDEGNPRESVAPADSKRKTGRGPQQQLEQSAECEKSRQEAAAEADPGDQQGTPDHPGWRVGATVVGQGGMRQGVTRRVYCQRLRICSSAQAPADRWRRARGCARPPARRRRIDGARRSCTHESPLRRRAVRAARRAGCRRGGSSRPRSGCRCAAARATRVEVPSAA